MPKKTDNTQKISPAMKHVSQRHADGKESRKGEGSRGKITGKSLAGGGKTKDGCFPGLLLLILPFLAAGSLLLFK